MHFSFLTAIVALASIMSVSACSGAGSSCRATSNCCANQGLTCTQTVVGVVYFASSVHPMAHQIFALCNIRCMVKSVFFIQASEQADLHIVTHW
ncbi:hypothetical protein DEU56DRAFT_814706 [Suillus clintonianus]|uniref:uncharacterized protein n=1 Tax=Suillus clintonianus TaxID=1904413 RepID=UPI001B880BCE|nr:uncharacterized protein DEU56DRAFT_814706 [Suillus clintonianus]KAG2130857.1 hypothetical protein DEU56DRAFT_814706 [Suillus clintonianus]